MEQCHHYHSDTGKRCKAAATTQVYIQGGTANPIPWRVNVCTAHAQFYVHQQVYKVRSL